MNRYICIHGHFYQPPRENPWLEEVEQQDSAYPYHDWNEKITAECYAPNTASRFLDSEDRIIDIVNNYASISFNFGPTLLSWMQRHKPDVYNAVLRADSESRKKFSGHGAALAQVYNHLIMPLANSRDKRTQVYWGIRDFEHRFGRKPEGMWLAETAVDLETLDIMAEYEIKFTILAPHQAFRIREMGAGQWQDVTGQKVDPKQPYLCRLPSGRTIVIFFYDGPISHEVSFGDLLANGKMFADRLLCTFSDTAEPQLVHIATDGETFGHHHQFGEMALAYCLHYIESNDHAKITIYGEYLDRFPPTSEVEIFESTSWSCVHGVARWRDDCGCSTGKHASWTQAWRAHLREAMDWLRDTLMPLYEKEASLLVHNPWQARDDYIEVIFNRSAENINAFFSRHAVRSLSQQEAVNLLKLLEMQRYAMLMYTSCGWFFDDISGIETIQILYYAAFALQSAQEVSAINFEPNFLNILSRASSNVPESNNGEAVYMKFVKPAISDLLRAGAHYAVSSVFNAYPRTVSFFCYTATSTTYDVKQAGIQRLALGKATIHSHISWEQTDISFAVLHLGGHNIIGGITPLMVDDRFAAMRQEIDEAFMKSDITEVIHLIEKHFDKSDYSLWHIFRDDQRRILSQVINSTLQERETSFTQAYEQYYPLMLFMREMSMPLPKAFQITAEFTINTQLRNLLESDGVNLDELERLIGEVKRWSVEVDKTTLNFVATLKITSLLKRLYGNPDDLVLLQNIHALLGMLGRLTLQLNLWQAQNIYFSIGKKSSHEMKSRAQADNEKAGLWIEYFNSLGNYLHVKTIV